MQLLHAADHCVNCDCTAMTATSMITVIYTRRHLTIRALFSPHRQKAFRRSGPDEPRPLVKAVRNRSRSVTVPNDFREIFPSGMNDRKSEHKSMKTSLRNTSPLVMHYEIRLTWVLTRQQTPHGAPLLTWSEFSKKLCDSDVNNTVVGPMPIINKKEHELDTIWTATKVYQETIETLV